ncbi:group 1 glycosyl transferase [Aminobacter sp. DSM 101952]|uniref:glycosyltransferase family 4 protein n=1 Tax=Aminobacter sp. DSM 101952 TaxID=2735891 RepID=UPI0006F77034|nr:glycosyltransferase family 4 protein [Aminobacter sp. DSM 101952]KQU76589.1 group 1 glycosyl transferase [Aminobacter sp. DSM 101952]
MRITHLVTHAGLNGVATSSKTLIQAQLDAGHDVMLVHSQNSWIERQKFDGPLEKMGSGFATAPAELRRVGYAARDWGVDVVHTHGSRGNKFGLVFRCAAGTPIVMTAHTRQFQLPWLFAHAVIAPSQQTADYYLSHWLVRRRNMHLVRHMFDVGTVEAATPASQSAARAKLGLKPSSFVIGSVGEIDARKNQIDMVRMLKGLVGRGIDAELLLVGSTRHIAGDAEWSAAAADPQIQGRLHMSGERQDATRLLHAMDVYLCTSKMEEGPIATLEAMASALPVLSVDVGYSAALLRNGVNGWVFSHGERERMTETASMLAGDAALRRTVGIAARQTIADHLAPQAIVPEIDTVYRQAIERAGKKLPQK